MNPLTELLRPHVTALLADAEAGNQHAVQVIKLYRMHQSCPNDPGAPTFCRLEFDQWRASKAVME